MRVIFYMFALAFLLAGLLFGALNSTPLAVELYVTRFELSAGVALLAAASFGALLGGLVMLFGVAWPLRRDLRRLRRQAALAESSNP